MDFAHHLVDRRLALSLLFALVFRSFTAQALAADTVIGFDSLAAGTEVSNQFHDQGVDLDTKLGGGAKQFPVVADDASASSAPNVLDISNSYPNEFPGAYLRGTFTDPHHVKVSAKVRGRGFVSGPATGTTTLTAYDVSGKVVATGTIVAPPPGSGFALLQATSAKGDIARFELTCYNDLLFLDDLTFDTIAGAPKPDFAAVATGLEVARGGSASSTIFLRRFNGSSGDVLLNVGNLPRGVSVSSLVPNPISGPDGTTGLLTLTADSSVIPEVDRPLTLTGLPSPSAGQFGPHASTFLLTILDSYDAQIVGMEVTQAIQSYQLPAGSVDNRPLHGIPVPYNGVPLAAGGRTVVRVFPDFAVFPENSAVPQFVCTLAASQNGVPIPGGLAATPGPAGLLLGANFVDDRTRAKPASVCNFTLPLAWTSGTITLTAGLQKVPVFGRPASDDCCADNDTFTVTDIPFTPTRDLFFAPFALRVNGGFLGFPDDVFGNARTLLPLGEGQFHMGNYSGEIDITDIWNQDVKACGILGLSSCPEDDLGRGASALARLRDIADELNFTESGELVVGIYPQSDPVSGRSDRIRSREGAACTGPFWDCDELSAMVAQNQLRPLTSVAHELGHMMGRNHASFDCGAGDVDNNGPADHWPPDEHGYIQGVGVDPLSFQVLFPDRTGGNLGGPYYDFMSYCSYGNEAVSWISVRGWNDTLKSLATGAPGSRAPLFVQSKTVRPEKTADVTAVLVVQGFVDAQGNTYITKVRTDRRPPRTPRASSPYHLVVLGRSGETLSDTSMSVATGYVHHLGPTRFLSAQVAVSDAASVEIRVNGTPVARRERPNQEPKVWDVDVRPDRAPKRNGPAPKCSGTDEHDHEKPGCGEDGESSRVTLVKWHSKNPAGVPLTVKVDYSADDGKTWRPVFFGPNRNRVKLSSAMLTSAEHARVRVRLSDGFNEQVAVSRHFREAGAAPVVRITSPAPGSVLRSGETLYASADAYDDRHESMAGDQLSWYAGSKLVGTGRAISISSLPVGTTSLQLVARDSQGRRTLKSVDVRVLP